MNPLLPLKAAVSGIWGGLLRTPQEIAERLALTPVYISHLLWLISQKFRDLARQGYGGNAAVYAVLRLLSISVPEPPLIAYVRDADGDPKAALPWTHPLRALLRHPNPYTSEFEMWELATLFCGITGRSVWWKERSNAGELLALWPLRPDRVGPIYAKAEDAASNPATRVLLGWSYQIPGTLQYLGIPADDCVVFNFPDPAGESGGLVEGLGPLQVLASEVGADNEATRFVGDLLHNHAQPLTVLTVQGKLLNKDDAKAIKQGFMQDFGGARRGQPAVVDGGATVTSLGFSLQQLEFPSLRKISESRISGAFGVPAILAGLLVGLEASSTNATIDELRALFAETTLASYWRRFSDTFTNSVAIEFGDHIVCLFDLTKVRALAAQSSVRLAEIRDGYVNGAVTTNEYRDALGLVKRADGDTYMYGIAPGRGVETPAQAAGQESDAQSNAAKPGNTQTPEQTDQANESGTTTQNEKDAA